MDNVSDSHHLARHAAPSRARARSIVQLFVLVALFGFLTQDSAIRMTSARASVASSSDSPSAAGKAQGLLERLDSAAARLRRAQSIANFARRYHITTRLSTEIYSAAENAGLDPELAFRLVKVESNFDERATSPAGAVGLTQLMFGTAIYYDRNLTEERLYDRQANLRIGFRHLRELIDDYDGDISLALAAYNRGSGAVRMLLAQGQMQTAAYERVILRGYNGRGVME